MTLLAIPIAQNRFEKALEAIESAVRQGADILELRTDYLEELSSACVGHLIAAVHQAGKPALVTCRDQAEGGNRPIDLAVRTEIWVGALRQGADFIDCEFRNFQKPQVRSAILMELQQHPAAHLIVSAHNFQGPFENLTALYDNMVACCPQAIPKIAFVANRVSDCLPAFDLLLARCGDAIVIAMGAAGQITRILAKKFGALLTFACLEADSATAPGQMGLSQFRDYRWDSLREDTQVYGVIGNPIAHSMSPAIFNALFEALQINAVYVPVLLEGGFPEFAGFLDGLRSRQESHGLDFHGFSVTIPHKSNTSCGRGEASSRWPPGSVPSIPSSSALENFPAVTTPIMPVRSMHWSMPWVPTGVVCTANQWQSLGPAEPPELSSPACAMPGQRSRYTTVLSKKPVPLPRNFIVRFPAWNRPQKLPPTSSSIAPASACTRIVTPRPCPRTISAPAGWSLIPSIIPSTPFCFGRPEKPARSPSEASRCSFVRPWPNSICSPAARPRRGSSVIM